MLNFNSQSKAVLLFLVISLIVTGVSIHTGFAPQIKNHIFGPGPGGLQVEIGQGLVVELLSICIQTFIFYFVFGFIAKEDTRRAMAANENEFAHEITGALFDEMASRIDENYEVKKSRWPALEKVRHHQLTQRYNAIMEKHRPYINFAKYQAASKELKDAFDLMYFENADAETHYRFRYRTQPAIKHYLSKLDLFLKCLHRNGNDEIRKQHELLCGLISTNKEMYELSIAALTKLQMKFYADMAKRYRSLLQPI